MQAALTGGAAAETGPYIWIFKRVKKYCDRTAFCLFKINKNIRLVNFIFQFAAEHRCFFFGREKKMETIPKKLE